MAYNEVALNQHLFIVCFGADYYADSVRGANIAVSTTGKDTGKDALALYC